MGYYFMKYHLPHHHREIHASYFYMKNSQLKINHKIVHKWANAVLTEIHTVIITPNHTVLQECDNVVRKQGHTNTKTVTYYVGRGRYVEACS